MGLIFCYFCKNNICENKIRMMDGYRLGKARDHPIYIVILIFILNDRIIIFMGIYNNVFVKYAGGRH